MKKAVTGFFDLFGTRSAAGVLFVLTVFCVLGYVVGTGYAEGGGGDKWVTVRMRVTAYCPCSECCGRYSDGVTASGHEIRQGDFFVAADKQYPFGTEMMIPGYAEGIVKVLDRGGVIKGNRVDVFFHTHIEALAWGVREVDVQIR